MRVTKPRRAKSWRKKLLAEFKPLIKARDGRCLNGGNLGGSCGGHLHCSHIWPEGEYSCLALHPLNAVSLCTKHHLWWWHKNILAAAEWLPGVLGEDWMFEVWRLRVTSSVFKNYKWNDWLELWIEYDLVKEKDVSYE